MVIAQNTSKVLQEAYQKTNKGLIKLTRQLHKLEQYSRRECLDITSIPSNINKKYLGKFLLYLFDEIGVKLNENQIIRCHRLGKTDQTTVKLLNYKDVVKLFL